MVLNQNKIVVFKSKCHIYLYYIVFSPAMNHYDVAIVGGGVIGSAIAHELSQYTLKVAVFEQGSDVVSGTSKANSGVIHSGINSPVGSLKARFCVQGNRLFPQLAKDLGFSLKWVGKYHIARTEEEVKELEQLKIIGIKNGVTGLKIVKGSLVKKSEPNITCHSALWVPTAGIILPYEFTIALAEHAALNGAQFFLETKVTGLKKHKDTFEIDTNKRRFSADVVINAAGINCRDIVSMIEEPDFNVYHCRGEYLILDKKYSTLIGPSAEFIDEKEDTQTTEATMKLLMDEAKMILPSIPKKGVIAAYAGIRCKLASKKEGGWADYRIEGSKENSGFINLLGIESPGLTAAMPIAQEVTRLVEKHKTLKAKSKIIPLKHKQQRFIDLPKKEQNKLIKKNPQWGRIICRCENITEAEVIEALNNPLGAQTLASVKYRCRAGMGRCQGGFCTQHIVRIMEQYLKQDIKTMRLKSPQSYLFSGHTREVNKHQD
jgi:glycerol-3-phosphate dehydrogenase